MNTWWVDRKAARQKAKRAALKAHWDARREAVYIPRGNTTINMMELSHAHLVTMALRDFSVYIKTKTDAVST
jgi:hypothetical protein